MDDSEEDKGTAQLVASEASAGTKAGGGDCNDLAIRRDVDANAHAGMRKGMGDLSSSNAKVALKKNREKQARHRKNMSAEKCAGEQKIWIVYVQMRLRQNTKIERKRNANKALLI
jgi:hypothetical protein